MALGFYTTLLQVPDFKSFAQPPQGRQAVGIRVVGDKNPVFNFYSNTELRWSIDVVHVNEI